MIIEINYLEAIENILWSLFLFLFICYNKKKIKEVNYEYKINS